MGTNVNVKLQEQLRQTPSPKPGFKLPNGRVNTGHRKMRRPRYYHIILNKAWYRQQLP